PHDLETRHDGAAVAGRNLDVLDQAAIATEADQRALLAGTGLDVDVGHALLVGVNDDFVDELDQFVVGSGADVFVAGVCLALRVAHGFEQIADIGVVGERPAAATEGLVGALLELAYGGDGVLELALGKYVVDDARALDLL